jgi:signal peptide peptidase SppA
MSLRMKIAEILSLRRRLPTVAVLRMHGVLAAQAPGPFRPSLNLAAFAGPIEAAFKLSGLKAVALSINSPGGSPAQSALLHDRIRQLADEKAVPVYAFVEDVGASGGYWLACAADEIYANASSIVGSIGVITSTFGFHEAIRRLGVERRLFTSGERKSLLDPFLPERPEDVERLRSLQRELHETFKAHVRGRRGARLKGAEAELFSGEFWTGQKAAELGLVDGVGEMRQVMRQKLGDKTRFRVVQPGKGWLQRRLGVGAGAAPDPAGWVEGALAAVETRALWSRFGL